MTEVKQRCLSPVSNAAYRHIDTTAIGIEHAASLHREFYAFAKMSAKEQSEARDNAPYINTSDVFPYLEGLPYYNLKAMLIIKLQSFQFMRAHKLIDPSEALAQTMEINAILDTMKVQGAQFTLPVLLGNCPRVKTPIRFKEKKICVLELCEYIKIRTNDAALSKCLEMCLMSTLGPRITRQDTAGIMQSIVDIYHTMNDVPMNKQAMASWAASEYMALSFGKKRVY